MMWRRLTRPNLLLLTDPLLCSPSHRPLTCPQCQPSRDLLLPPLPPPAPPRHSCSSSQTASHTFPSIPHPCPSCKPWPIPRLWGLWWTCLRTSFRATGWGSSLGLLPSHLGVGFLPTQAWPLVSNRVLVHCHSRALYLCRWPSPESHATVWVWPIVGATWGLITRSQPAASTGDARRRRGNSHHCGSARLCFHPKSQPPDILVQTSTLSPSTQRYLQSVQVPHPFHRDASNASRGPKARQTRWKSSHCHDKLPTDWHEILRQFKNVIAVFWTVFFL